MPRSREELRPEDEKQNPEQKQEKEVESYHNYYVIKGPSEVGNVFGYPKSLEAGKFVVVENGEYSNGGRGPSIAFKGAIFDNEAEAKKIVEDQEKKNEELREWEKTGRKIFIGNTSPTPEFEGKVMSVYVRILGEEGEEHISTFHNDIEGASMMLEVEDTPENRKMAKDLGLGFYDGSAKWNK